MKTSIATVSLSGDLADKLTAAAAAGFDGVEIFEADFLSYDASPATVGRMVRDAGLDVTLFQPFRDFEGLPEPFRAKAFDRAERKFDVMGELGADLILICSSCSPHALGGIDRAAADLAELGERAARRGIRIGYEALAWGRFVNDHRDAWEIVRRASHPHVGLVLDSFHSLARNIDSASIRAIPADRLFLIQLADAPKLDLDLLSWSRHFRNMPGQGDLPVADFMAAVAATGYDGVISLEIFNDQFRAGSARQVAVDGKRALTFLMDEVHRRDRTARPEASSRPVPVPVEPALLPPRARCSGIAFVEFAVDDATAEPLATLFSALGFRLAGRHRSKEVTLWAQGDVRLVLNQDKEGFAHSAFLAHGPNVCALGLKLDDARAGLARAEALGSRRFAQRNGPGELAIPAVRGVGGSLVYFVDDRSELARQWETDFDLVPGWQDWSGIGLTRVDHVAQTTRPEEMLTWLLFYRALLAVEKSPVTNIPDPGGLVQSQVLRSADDALKIVLNGSQSPRTLSARFLEDFFGSGIQHVAFAAGDIFAAAASLKQAGVETLPIPANYYDDLEARTFLDAETIARLKENGILYDSDESGDFFQIYTRSFRDGFFLEIVERRTGYAGFGAVNAPIRIAAQARLARPLAVPAH